jgi:hypothetical protein
MKISLLIDREPFDKIFEDTFSSFLKDSTNFPHQVKWNAKNNNNGINDSVQTWYCNPLINSIFLKGANIAVFDSINKEYSNNPLKPWRSLTQKFYLHLAQHKITGPLLAKYTIDITPPINNGINKLIIGGNTKIRMIDISDKKVYVILKKGFDKMYLEREIYVRNNFKYLPIPKIQSQAKNGMWYCEDYVVGVSPDRIGGAKGQDILYDAIQHLHKILNETKMNESLLGYVGFLQERINKNIVQILHIDSGIRKEILNLVLELSIHINNYSESVITTAYCHGDFQEGNIIYDGGKTFILDWEYSDRKQIGYDLFVLILKSRVSNGFVNRYTSMMNNKLSYDQLELIKNWPGIEWNTNKSIDIYLSLFLLEELDFHIRENANIHFIEESTGLKVFFQGVKKIFDNISKN